ncbi:MAG: hypothetical protein M3395_00150 [Chloroflexota bacterium]|nr:hypothetical protein [Chloroflexota bacterium]
MPDPLTPTLSAPLAPPLTPGQKYEKVAFTFCKMGTTGLLVWLVSPAVFVLAVSVLAVAFYGRALSLGMKRSRCFLRKPTLIIGVWAAIGVADAIWLFALGGRMPVLP